MLSREDRILSELIVGRGLATPEAVEKHARELEDSNEKGLVRAMVSRGELDEETGRQVQEEAREISELLRADLPEGKTLGEFRLLREIGRGGMGIVYEAEQASLGRRVALKVLPAGAALDERLAIRFLREARTAARLRHPGIVPVFGTGREQGVLFFAMELVEGENLAARIDRGPIPAGEAAGIASEVAHALQHAHDSGLVHRDIKPENVMIGADGRARLTDFGLVHDIEGARLTRSQYVLGTPAYSAPEQARGAPVDPRSDVYGVGAVLYAMLSGGPPFSGEVPAAVLGRLINEPPPPLARAAPETPQSLVAICERAMARDPERRYSDAGSLAEALDRFLADGESARDPRPPRGRRGRGLAVGAVAAAGLIAAALWIFGFGGGVSAPDPAAAPLRAGLLRGVVRPLPTPAGVKQDLALSPNGQTVAYVTGTDSEDWLIQLQDVGAREPRRLLPGFRAAWSPDGTRIAFCRSALVEIVELASGGVARTDVGCGGLSWSPDGRRLVTTERDWPTTRARVVDLSSGASQLITGPGTASPDWSADGRIAFVALEDGQYDIWTAGEDGGGARRVTEDAAREWSPVWSSVPGRLYYGSNLDESPDLWSVDLDVETGEVLSGPTRVTHGWMGYPFKMKAARERERLAFVQVSELSQHWILGLGPRSAVQGPPRRLNVDLPFDADLPQRAADREDWIVAAGGAGSRNLHRFGSAAAPVPITGGPYRDEAPRWSPDGESIAFHSDRSGGSQIWTVRADGSGLEQITRGGRGARLPVWSPDGRRLAYSVSGEVPRVVSLDDGNHDALPAEPGFEAFEPWSWSADGERLAGTADGIAIFDVASGRYTRITDYGARPSWIGESAELLFTHEDRVFHWDGGERPRAIWSTGPNRLATGLSLRSDGREVYFTAQASKERIWILDLDAEIRE